MTPSDVAAALSTTPHAIRYLEAHMKHLLDVEPVRLYSIAVALLAIVAFYVPSLPVGLFVALVAAVLGVGQKVRSKVTPTAKQPKPLHSSDGTDTWVGLR